MSAAGPSTSSQRGVETVDERTVITCVQTEEGRAAARPPQCHLYSIRYLSEAAAKAHSNVPLPAAGNRDALVQGQVSIGPQTKYWRPGTYMFYTANLADVRRHLRDMSASPAKQRQVAVALEDLGRKKAAYERRMLLHKMGKAPHPGPVPASFDLHWPLHDTTTMFEITPSVLTLRATESLRKTIAPALRVWSETREKIARDEHTELGNAWLDSLRRNDPGALVRLLGRVTNDYFRVREEQRKAQARIDESSPGRDKAP